MLQSVSALEFARSAEVIRISESPLREVPLYYIDFAQAPICAIAVIFTTNFKFALVIIACTLSVFC